MHLMTGPKRVVDLLTSDVFKEAVRTINLRSSGLASQSATEVYARPKSLPPVLLGDVLRPHRTDLLCSCQYKAQDSTETSLATTRAIYKVY